MSTTQERINALEEQGGKVHQDTIIPMYQTPNVCVFCTEKDHDSLFYEIYRHIYEDRMQQEYPRQDKETCIHHKDGWLKHSLHSAGYLSHAIIRDKDMTNGEVGDVLKDKEQSRQLLAEKFEKDKHFSAGMHIYLRDWSKVKKEDMVQRYGTNYDCELIIPIEEKLIKKKMKIHYDKALEVVNNLELN